MGSKVAFGLVGVGALFGLAYWLQRRAIPEATINNVFGPGGIYESRPTWNGPAPSSSIPFGANDQQVLTALQLTSVAGQLNYVTDNKPV